MKGFRLHRRAVLRGVGATLGLPWLEAMAAGASRAAAPVRMGVLFMPNGVHPGKWTPAKTGRKFPLSPTLAPLGKRRDDVLVLTNLWNESALGPEGHYRKVAGLLSSTTITKTLGADISCNGVSVDQVAAQSVAGQTPLPSMELAIEPVRTGVDRVVGYTRVYGAHIAWAGPKRPLPREINPRLAYERLMRAANPTASDAERDKRLLDRVLVDAKRLQDKLGMADRRRMEEYLSGVRALEQRIERAEGESGEPWEARVDMDGWPPKPAGIPATHPEHVRLMLDIMAMAFQADITRVSTFLYGNSVSNQNFSFLDGVDGAHHSTSHHQEDADKMRQYQLINQWHVEQYAYLLNKLAAMPEGDGSVLDNSMILFLSGLRDGQKHDPRNLPVVLGGKGGGYFETGRHLKYAEDSPLSNLYMGMLEAFGTPVARFADSTGGFSNLRG